jgi:hypothetical protein
MSATRRFPGLLPMFERTDTDNLARPRDRVSPRDFIKMMLGS